jgi:hypothetical protein
MAQSIVKTYSTAGTYTLYVPLDVTSISVELWGGGGTGGPATGTASGAGGGAGGQYAIKTVTVTGGSSHTLVVAAAKTSATAAVTNGNDSSFDSTTVVAKGGAGGANATGATSNGGTGATTNGVGDTVYAGGSGGNGVSSTQSAGGGGGAGSTGAGGAGSGATAGNGTSQQGGNGGAGVSTANTRNAGTQAGGGGSGGLSNSSTDRAGGNGAAGYARVTYTTSDVDIFSVTNQSDSGAITTSTVSVVVPTGYSNVRLEVGVLTYADLSLAAAQVTGVTYNGVALTLDKAQTGPAGVRNYTDFWYLDSPSTGTNNLVITITGGAGTNAITSSTLILINSATGGADATNGGTTAGADNTSIAVTSIADRAIMFSGTSAVIGNTGPSVGVSQLTLYNPSATEILSFSAAKTPAGSVTHTYGTGNAADSWTVAAVTLKPYVASAVNSGFFGFV